MKKSITVVLLAVALAGCQPATNDATGAVQETPNTPPSVPAPGDPLRPGSDSGMPSMAKAERDSTPVDSKVINIRLSDRGDTEANTISGTAASFAPKDTVYAEIETSGTADGYNIYAKWMAPDGSVLSDYGMRVNEAGMKRTVISLSKPDGWESGEHSLEIAINGAIQRTIKFPVR